MIRLLIVEDQPAVQKGLHMRLAVEPDLSMIGEVSDCKAALSLATSLNPDVVLVDIDMLNMEGMVIVDALHKLCPQVPVIILSIHDDTLTRACGKDAGATAFVAKSMPADTLLTAIRQVIHS
jgi:DNA-binding NarL/FixJ family response regulator